MTTKKKPTKAPNGAGSISDLGNGKSRVFVTTDAGRVSQTCASEDGEIVLRRLLVARDEGRLRAPAKGTLSAYLVSWLEGKQGDLRPHSHDQYRSLCRRAAAVIGTVRLTEIRASHVETLRQTLKTKERLAPASTNAVLRCLRSALADAVRDDLITTNPAVKVRYLDVSRPPRATLPPEMVPALFSAAAGTEWLGLWHLLIGCGLRVGEALALRREDHEAGILHIRHTLTNATGRGWFLGPAKSESSRRDIVLPAPVADALTAHRALIARRALQTEGWVDQGLLFPGRKGRFGRPERVNRLLARHLESIGAAPLTAHQLRHSCATYHLLMGTRLEVVRDLLGHSTLAMTSDLYSHVLRSMEEEAANRMGAFLGGQSG